MGAHPFFQNRKGVVFVTCNIFYLFYQLSWYDQNGQNPHFSFTFRKTMVVKGYNIFKNTIANSRKPIRLTCMKIKLNVLSSYMSKNNTSEETTLLQAQKGAVNGGELDWTPELLGLLGVAKKNPLMKNKKEKTQYRAMTATENMSMRIRDLRFPLTPRFCTLQGTSCAAPIYKSRMLQSSNYKERKRKNLFHT